MDHCSENGRRITHIFPPERIERKTEELVSLPDIFSTKFGFFETARRSRSMANAESPLRGKVEKIISSQLQEPEKKTENKKNTHLLWQLCLRHRSEQKNEGSRGRGNNGAKRFAVSRSRTTRTCIGYY
jgi:hypothetical protein